MPDDQLYPFEFVVEGTPRTLQTKNKDHLQEWRDAVAAAAQERRDAACPCAYLDEMPLAATIYYFAPAPFDRDVDNIVKPILDALITVAYPDDRLIERVVAQKFDPSVARVFETLTEQLSIALEAEPPVVYVRIDADLTWRSVK